MKGPTIVVNLIAAACCAAMLALLLVRPALFVTDLHDAGPDGFVGHELQAGVMWVAR